LKNNNVGIVDKKLIIVNIKKNNLSTSIENTLINIK